MYKQTPLIKFRLLGSSNGKNDPPPRAFSRTRIAEVMISARSTPPRHQIDSIRRITKHIPMVLCVLSFYLHRQLFVDPLWFHLLLSRAIAKAQSQTASIASGERATPSVSAMAAAWAAKNLRLSSSGKPVGSPRLGNRPFEKTVLTELTSGSEGFFGKFGFFPAPDARRAASNQRVTRPSRGLMGSPNRAVWVCHLAVPPPLALP